MDIHQIQTDLSRIIRDTEKLDFPIFSTFEKKQAIVENERKKIDAQIKRITEEIEIDFTDIGETQELFWEEADQAAKEAFGPLSEKEMLNGFYLQEVMHRYAELQANAILEMIGTN